MCRKIVVLSLMLIVVICIAGCSTTANLYVPQNSKAAKSNLKQPNTEGKSVLILLTRTRNFVNNKTVKLLPLAYRKDNPIIKIWSNNFMTGFEPQIFHSTRNEDNCEWWQIFTLPVKPGVYKLEGFYLLVGMNMLKENPLSCGISLPKNVIEAKCGEFIFLGRMNLDIVDKSSGLADFISSSYSAVYSWDSSPDNIDFIRKQIPQLKNVEIADKNLSFEF